MYDHDPSQKIINLQIYTYKQAIIAKLQICVIQFQEKMALQNNRDKRYPTNISL